MNIFNANLTTLQYLYQTLSEITGCGIFSAAAPTCIALYGAYLSNPKRPSPTKKT